jgi:hypothetical protein
MKEKGGGLRYNNGKVRFDLISPFAEEQLAKVLTLGAEKYAPRNWESGMKWTTVLQSLLRHVHAFKKGEDYDSETGLLHMAHAMCNIMFLLEYHKIYPQGDDRVKPYLELPRIGVDVDEVLADWVQSFMWKYGMETRPMWWNFDRTMGEKYSELADDTAFWMSIEAKTKASALLFEPACYITARNIPTEITENWLENHGFPANPVFTVSNPKDKLKIIKENAIDIFIDDSFDTFKYINDNGGCCFLMDAPHNRRFDVGYRRIYDVNEVLFPLGKKSNPPKEPDYFTLENIVLTPPKKGNMSGTASLKQLRLK